MNLIRGYSIYNIDYLSRPLIDGTPIIDRERTCYRFLPGTRGLGYILLRIKLDSVDVWSGTDVYNSFTHQIPWVSDNLGDKK